MHGKVWMFSHLIDDEDIDVYKRQVGVRGADLVTDNYWEQIDLFSSVEKREKQMKKMCIRDRHMGFSKPSISHAVGVLRDGGFLTMDEDGFLHLTDIGPVSYTHLDVYKRQRYI